MKSLIAGKLLRVILWMVWLSACAPIPVQNQPTTAAKKSSLPNITQAATASPTLLSPSSANPATDSSPVSASTDLPGLDAAHPLTPVRIDEPQDDAVVQDGSIQIKGEANPGTVVSINDEIVLVDSTRKFSVRIQLDEGLNVIEIIASDEQGNQESQYLSITYEPQ